MRVVLAVLCMLVVGAHAGSQAALQQKLEALSLEAQDHPYKIHAGVIGEGCAPKKKDCVAPMPLIRTDHFDCYSYVLWLMAKATSTDRHSFWDRVVQLNYHHTPGMPDLVHHVNRNHFMAAQFNPFNEALGALANVHPHPPFKAVSQVLHIHQSLYPWYQKAWHAASPSWLPAQTRRALQQRQHIQLAYVPKGVLMHDGQPTRWYQRLPTPSVIEFVYRPQGQVAVPVHHMGVLLQRHFAKGALIYPEIHCSPACHVVPHICHEAQGCTRLMLSHATSMYPKTCRLSNSHGHYRVTTEGFACNRVVNMPLKAYLMDRIDGVRSHFHHPDFLGVHVATLRSR